MSLIASILRSLARSTIVSAYNAGVDVWFEWTADCDGFGFFSTCGSNFVTIIMAYGPGSPCPPTVADEITCSAAGCPPSGSENSEMSFPCVAGNTYLVKVTGWSGETGVGSISAECVAGPPSANDDCDDAIELVSGTPLGFSIITSTIDGPDSGCNTTPTNDIWYEWTADCDGIGTISTCGSDYDGEVVIYAPGSPCPPTAADEVICNDFQDCIGAEAVFQCTAGNTYLVKVGGWYGAVGAGTIQAECGMPIANDECADREVLVTGVPASFTTGIKRASSKLPASGAI